LGRISAAIENIQLGNVYQLCLTNEISLETDADPLAVFLGMRHQTRAPYSAFLRIESVTLVSASPELFLKVSASGGLLTKPIKGTRARSGDAETDQMIARELQTNEKERAENLMIVDLMRNDFARVAKPDSVSVDGLFQVESYQTVHQLVSTVSAQLAPEFDAFDAIAATFPGGSMTGAPKPMAIKLIRRLEAGQRGVYSGVFGWIASTGTTELAMTIRTIVFQAGTAKIGVGGGITLDSDPEAEFEEIRLKASALLSALSAVDPW
jgi:anthranilate/para-aminobenzoate synthase component I